MHLFVLFGISVLCLNSVTFADNHVEGYYWREYTGKLPSDAVPGGSDKHGKPTFIGQTLHIFPPNGKLIPGKIDADEKQLYYAWNGSQYTSTKNIKILCSQNPGGFEWIDTDNTKTKSMLQDNLVLGGYDTDYPLFIGRKATDGEVVLGKVTIPPPYDAFGYTINDKAVFDKTTFEVLSYNPNKECKIFTTRVSDSSERKIVNINVY